MTIIKAEIQHLNDLVPLFNNYRMFYRQKSDAEAANFFLKKRIEKQDTTILIAYNKNKAVGFTQLFHSFSSISMQPIFILNDLFVDSDYRKQGFGVALLNKAKLLCKTLNYKGIGLQTETNNPAQHLYESLGWDKDQDLQYFWKNANLLI